MTTFDLHKEYWIRKAGVPSSMLPLPPAQTVLDLGCGGGRLSAAFPVYYGIDSAADLVAEARRQRSPHTFICGDFQSPDIWESLPVFDLIISNCAIRKDYCPDLERVAALCYDHSEAILLRIQAVDDLADILSLEHRQRAFYSESELREAFKLFQPEITQESYRQRFSSRDYLRTSLSRTQIECQEIPTLLLRRNYYVVRGTHAH